MSRAFAPTTFAVLALCCAAAAPPEAAPNAEREGPADSGWFQLAGQAGLPAYMKANAAALADAHGIRGGEIRTVARDLIEKDFVFDLVFRFENENDEAGFIIGIGENARSRDAIVNSVCSRVHGPGHGGYGTLTISGQPEGELGKFGRSVGPHLFRLAKKGNTLTMAVCANYDAEDLARDEFEPTVSKTLVDLKGAAPFLTKKNSAVFCEGGTFQAVRLVVDGRSAETAAAKRPAAGREVGPLFDLTGRAGLPQYLQSGGALLGDDAGVRGGTVRTAAADLVRHDFVFDAAFRFRDGKDGAVCVVGLGEGRRGDQIADAVHSRVHGPAHGGYGTVSIPGQPEAGLGNFGTEKGPHLFRIEKSGNTLTMSVWAGFDGQGDPESAPTTSRTIPDLKAVAPFLNKSNSSVFFEDGDVALTAVRLSIDGKAVDPGATRVGPPRDSDYDGPMFDLAGPAGIPSYLRTDVRLLADSHGLRGDGQGGEARVFYPGLFGRGATRTQGKVAAGAVASGRRDGRDFALDLLFEFRDGNDEGVAAVGVGNKNADGGWQSIQANLSGPGRGGQVVLGIAGLRDTEIGRYARSPGPHRLRLERKGQTVTTSVWVDYGMGIEDAEDSEDANRAETERADGGDASAPTFYKTIPNFRDAAPWLTPDSGLYFAGNCWFRAVRLTVDGKTVDVGPGPVENRAAPDTGVADARHLIRLDAGAALPTFFAPVKGLSIPDTGLVLGPQTLATVASAFVDKDFTFDVVFRFKSGEETALHAGIGANGQAGVHNVFSRLHGPGHNGVATVTVAGLPETMLGSPSEMMGTNPGPHLFRLQKRGRTLTMALCPGFEGDFQPTAVRTIPDLKALSPTLNAKNSYLFLSGGGVVEAVRLSVAGEPIETRDLALGLPARVVAGRETRHPIARDEATRGRGWGVASGPDGLAITPDGELRWTPSADQVGPHEVRVLFKAGAEQTVTVASIEVFSAEDAEAVAGGDLANVEALYEVALAGPKYDLATGADGRSMLLVDGDRLRVLEADGITVRRTLKLPKPYARIAERADYYVALSDEHRCLDLLDKQTLKVRLKVQMDYATRYDMALDPVRPVTYVAVNKGPAAPRGEVLVVREDTGEVFEPEGLVGQWVEASPDGKFLYTAYSDLVERAAGVLGDLAHVEGLERPRGRSFGGIEVLIAYDLGGFPPKPVRAKQAAGGGGAAGLAVSADGKRVSYLSMTGYPAGSGNVPAWDPSNFVKRPVSYPTREHGAACSKLSFHPVLNLAAAPVEAGGAVAFDRETGEAQPERLLLKYPPLGEVKVLDVHFSGDGRNLLLSCQRADGQWILRRVRLKLSDEEQARLQAGHEEGGERKRKE